MSIARKALVVTTAIIAVAWAWSAIAVVVEPLRGDALGWFFIVSHVAAFCAATIAAVFGTSSLVRSPETRKLGGYIVVIVSLSLWTVLSAVVIIVPRITPSDPPAVEASLGQVYSP